jgi:hypothetical protein
MDLHIRIYEGQDASYRGDMFQPDKQIMNLLAAPCGRSGDEKRCASTGGVGENAVECLPGWVGPRFNQE